MYKERIKVIIRQPDPYDTTTKQETLPKGVGVAKFDFTKIFRNQLLLRVRVLYHQYSITNHSESILKSKIMCISMIIFVLFFLSDLLRNILKCNCRPYSTLMAMYDLLQYYAAMYYNNSSMRKVQLLQGHVHFMCIG